MKTLKNSDGAAMVEFAIVLIPLMILVFGIIEFGIIMYDKAVITNASREGARAGIVFNSPALSSGDLYTAVSNAADPKLDPLSNKLITFGTESPKITVTGTCATSGTPLTVTVTYQYTYLVLPNIVSKLTGPLNLSATTVMNCE